MDNEFKVREVSFYRDDDEVKEALLFLYSHKRKGRNPSWLDYANALNYPIEAIIKAYNELIDEAVFSGQKVALKGINTDAKKVICDERVSPN
jgi:hypothetical protein